MKALTAHRKALGALLSAAILLAGCGGEGSGSESSSANDLTRAIVCTIFPFFCTAPSAMTMVPAPVQAVELISVTGTCQDLAGNGFAAGFSPGREAGDLDAEVKKLDPAGGLLWARRFGSPDIEYAEQVQTESDGAVVVMIVKHRSVEGYGGQTVRETYQLRLSEDGRVVGISQVAAAPGQ